MIGLERFSFQIRKLLTFTFLFFCSFGTLLGVTHLARAHSETRQPFPEGVFADSNIHSPEKRPCLGHEKSPQTAGQDRKER